MKGDRGSECTTADATSPNKTKIYCFQILIFVISEHFYIIFIIQCLEKVKHYDLNSYLILFELGFDPSDCTYYR